ncbi:MAG: SpoVG family protein [Clostridia bacterium]|nr:SpoVG family protein [Clostridia bacterium]
MDYKSKVNLYTKPGTLKGIASLSIGDEFVVKGLMVREGENGMFVSFPSTKVGDEYRDICFPITKEARDAITKTVLEAYREELKHVEEQINDAKQGEQKSAAANKGSAAKGASGKSQKSGAENKAADKDEKLSENGQEETLNEDASEPVMGM